MCSCAFLSCSALLAQTNTQSISSFYLGPSRRRQVAGKGLVWGSTPGMGNPWSAGVAVCSPETWRGQEGDITRTVLPCFTLTLLVRAMCIQRFSDYGRKNVNLYLCCIATVTKATKPYVPVFQEIINKVTLFLNHLLCQDAETENSHFC